MYSEVLEYVVRRI